MTSVTHILAKKVVNPFRRLYPPFIAESEEIKQAALLTYWKRRASEKLYLMLHEIMGTKCKNYIHCLLKIVPVWGIWHTILVKEALAGFRKQFQLLKYINQGIDLPNKFKEPFSLYCFYHTQSKGFLHRICFIHL